MTEARRRRRAPAQQTNQSQTQTSAPAQGGVAWMDKGNVGIAHSQQESAQAAERKAVMMSQPYQHQRFWLNANEEATLVVLDRSLNDVPFMHEHHFKNPQTQKWDGLELCPKEFEPCPVCDGRVTGATTNPYYAMYLSVIDTRQYVKKDRTVVPFGRKLLVIKAAQHTQFFELLNSMQSERGTLRGMVIKLRRSDESTAPRHGSPCIVANGRMYGVVSEEKIQTSFQHPPVLNRENKQVVAANEFQQPINYNEAFPQPSEHDICVRRGLPAPANTSAMDANAMYNEQPADQTAADSIADDLLDEPQDGGVVDNDDNLLDTPDQDLLPRQNNQQAQGGTTVQGNKTIGGQAPTNFDSFDDDIPF